MKYLPLILLSFVVFTAHAEGGCQPGSYPQNGQGVHACIPTPSNNQGNSSVNSGDGQVWVDGWQAAATDSSKGVLGTATRMLTEGAATSAAIEDCQSKGGVTCVVNLSYRNGCIAMSTGASKIRFYGASTKDKAERQAMDACEANDTSCKIYYSECSAPKRVR